MNHLWTKRHFCQGRKTCVPGRIFLKKKHVSEKVHLSLIIRWGNREILQISHTLLLESPLLLGAAKKSPQKIITTPPSTRCFIAVKGGDRPGCIRSNARICAASIDSNNIGQPQRIATALGSISQHITGQKPPENKHFRRTSSFMLDFPACHVSFREG